MSYFIVPGQFPVDTSNLLSQNYPTPFGYPNAFYNTIENSISSIHNNHHHSQVAPVHEENHEDDDKDNNRSKEKGFFGSLWGKFKHKGHLLLGEGTYALRKLYLPMLILYICIYR